MWRVCRFAPFAGVVRVHKAHEDSRKGARLKGARKL